MVFVSSWSPLHGVSRNTVHLNLSLLFILADIEKKSPLIKYFSSYNNLPFPGAGLK